MGKVHKYNMGIVGNCSFLAYIDNHADVKWMCMPRFDSSFIFGSLLDKEQGGEFSVKPASANFSSVQQYIKNTNILITEFTTPEGKFRVTDFAPRFYQFDRFFRPLMLMRKIELLEGNPFIYVKCKPMGQYGKLKPDMVMGSNHIRYLNLETQVRLTTNIPLTYIINDQPFVLNDTKYLTFTYGVPLEASLEVTVEDFLEKTKNYWFHWIKNTSIPHIFQDEIIRSALVLKLHQYEDTGGIIASGTTSLPEYHNSGRNWDYRYCWMRDSYYTLNAFNSIGHFYELEKYFQYIQNIILSEKEKIQPMYTISGSRVTEEVNIGLDGYMGNKPVHVGNNAFKQEQNDIYGQVLVSLLPLYIDKRLNYIPYQKSKAVIHWLLDRISQTIDRPDAGIWEFRNAKQFHSYTYLFHWAGSKAAFKIARFIDDKELEIKSLGLIKLSEDKLEQCFNPDKKAYMQAIGVDRFDASSLQLITMGYLDNSSEKAKLHLEALENALKTPEGLFYRYIHADDFGAPETTFLVCAFWYAEALACVGRVDESIAAIERLIGYSNHLGLYSEDVGTDGSQWGNFPQTYSHVGLMNAVYRIATKLDKPYFY